MTSNSILANRFTFNIICILYFWFCLVHNGKCERSSNTFTSGGSPAILSGSFEKRLPSKGTNLPRPADGYPANGDIIWYWSPLSIGCIDPVQTLCCYACTFFPVNFFDVASRLRNAFLVSSLWILNVNREVTKEK